MSGHGVSDDRSSEDKKDPVSLQVSKVITGSYNTDVIKSSLQTTLRRPGSVIGTERPILPTTISAQLSHLNQPSTANSKPLHTLQTAEQHKPKVHHAGMGNAEGTTRGTAPGQSLAPAQYRHHMVATGPRLPGQTSLQVQVSSSSPNTSGLAGNLTPGMLGAQQAHPQVSIISRPASQQGSVPGPQQLTGYQANLGPLRGASSALSGPRPNGSMTPILRPPNTLTGGPSNCQPVIQPRAAHLSAMRAPTPAALKSSPPVVAQTQDTRSFPTSTTTVQITIQPTKTTVEVTPRTTKPVYVSTQSHKVMISQPAIGGHTLQANKPGTVQMTPQNQMGVPTSTCSASAVAVNSIPIAKVPPTRQHIPQTVISSTTPPGDFQSRPAGASEPASGSGGLFLSQNHRSSPNTATATALSMTTSDSRHEGRPPLPMGPSPYMTYFNPMATAIGMEYMMYNQRVPAQATFRPTYGGQPSSNLAAQLQAAAHTSSPSLQLNSAGGTVVVDPRKISAGQNHFAAISGDQGSLPSSVTVTSRASSPPPNSSTQPGTPNASPRPSILRKRTNDGVIIRKPNITPVTLDSGSPRSRSATNSPKPTIPGITHPDSTTREHTGHSSTDTAPSTENNSPAPSTTPLDNKIKQELLEDATTPVENGGLASSLSSALSVAGNNLNSSFESSPRKKPRKQTFLPTNEKAKDGSSTEEETETTKVDVKAKSGQTERLPIKQEYIDDEGTRWVSMRKRNNTSLLNLYNCTWKSKNNHFLRYTDVKQKDERRPTVTELSTQKGINQKASGWRLYHLAAQLDDMVELEKAVNTKIQKLQKSTTIKPSMVVIEEDVIKIQELIKGSKQRSQLAIDQLGEVKSSMLKLLEHKPKISEIIAKHHMKRTVKKKERM